MSRLSKSLLLEEQVGLLVRHFGLSKVQAALAKASPKAEKQSETPVLQTVSRAQRPIRPTIVQSLEAIRQTSPDKHRLLSEFLTQLKRRQVLAESQDIRQFAQLVGLKEISGKSRKDMIPKLMRFLLDLPIDRLRTDLQNASNISEQQRRMGFSVLTDKLLRNS
jgi:hypothetical protein